MTKQVNGGFRKTHREPSEVHGDERDLLRRGGATERASNADEAKPKEPLRTKCSPRRRA